MDKVAPVVGGLAGLWVAYKAWAFVTRRRRSPREGWEKDEEEMEAKRVGGFDFRCGELDETSKRFNTTTLFEGLGLERYQKPRRAYGTLFLKKGLIQETMFLFPQAVQPGLPFHGLNCQTANIDTMFGQHQA